MQHLAMKSLKKSESLDGLVHKILNTEFNAFVKMAFIRCDEFQLFLHCAVPKKECNCLEPEFWNFTQ